MSDKILKGLLVAGGFAAGFAASKYLDSRNTEAVEEPEDFDDDFFNESEVDIEDEPAKEETSEEAADEKTEK